MQRGSTRPGHRPEPLSSDTAMEVFPARLRDAWSAGCNAARVLDAEARGHRRSAGGRRRRLHQVRACYPPPPFRLYVLILVNVLTIAAFPSWIARTPGDWAVVSTRPLGAPGRHRNRLRKVAVLGTFEVCLAAFVFGIYLRQPELLVLVAVAMSPLVWVMVTAAMDAARTGPLRRCMRALLAGSRHPVETAVGLASGGGGAGTHLVRALIERADAAGVTIIARTEAGPLVALYERAGFRVAASAPTRWGQLVLVVREPRPAHA